MIGNVCVDEDALPSCPVDLHRRLCTTGLAHIGSRDAGLLFCESDRDGLLDVPGRTGRYPCFTIKLTRAHSSLQQTPTSSQQLRKHL
jgi:hypothetical protein